MLEYLHGDVAAFAGRLGNMTRKPTILAVDTDRSEGSIRVLRLTPGGRGPDPARRAAQRPPTGKCNQFTFAVQWPATGECGIYRRRLERPYWTDFKGFRAGSKPWMRARILIPGFGGGTRPSLGETKRRPQRRSRSSHSPRSSSSMRRLLYQRFFFGQDEGWKNNQANSGEKGLSIPESRPPRFRNVTKKCLDCPRKPALVY
jgi:hypothetical protein